MSISAEEIGFIEVIVDQPSDVTRRMVYADWLEEHGASDRATFLRKLPSFESDDCYQWSEDVAEARKKFDAGWLALITTLAIPFREFHFHVDDPAILPFAESIGMRGRFVGFSSQFNRIGIDEGVISDLTFLTGLQPDQCSYGAADMMAYPFMCESQNDATLGRQIVDALKAKNFRSEHIATLEAPSIEFPGYHPGTENDEIHNDLSQQFIFLQPPEQSTNHELLKNYVVDSHIWYVLLHHDPNPEYGFSHYVNLFAVGKSPHANRLVGVVTQQMCHNLCD